ncbi:MAG TPA: 3-isopropylmalate dehydratase small subunit [Clostridiaceae bacterium]|nr:3-isopropylmalate dehydratase small subunit [Clostridiaceae bacterium]
MIEGKAIKYGNNVDTDVIIPARHLSTIDPAELASHCMEDLDAHFNDKLSWGSIIAAGKNFGCGSSREHAPIAIKASGIKVVIAESFARIFFRNAINIGLPIIECPEAAREIEEGDDISIDVKTGMIVNKTKNKTYTAPAFPEFMEKIMEADGLIKYIKQSI